jgi:hypothetical protein
MAYKTFSRDSYLINPVIANIFAISNPLAQDILQNLLLLVNIVSLFTKRSS